jgi:hypothetical protein
MSADMNCGNSRTRLRCGLVMTAVMRHRRPGIAGGARRFARFGRERRAECRQGDHESQKGPQHPFASIRKFGAQWFSSTTSYARSPQLQRYVAKIRVRPPLSNAST